MGESLNLVTPPPEVVVSSLETKGKVLVVEADYFALTVRKDDNIVFWDANTTRTNGEIPKGVTHLWVSNHTNDGIRERLLFQAERRSIVVWSCALRELRRRLLPFWADDANRSLIDPVEPDDSSLAGGYRVSTLFEANKAKTRRLKLLKSAAERVAVPAQPAVSEKPQRRTPPLKLVPRPVVEPQAPESVREPIPESMSTSPSVEVEVLEPVPASPEAPSATPDWITALDKLPDLDKHVFSVIYGINTGKPPQSIESVAEEFALPEPNLKRILARVLAKLEPHGFIGH